MGKLCVHYIFNQYINIILKYFAMNSKRKRRKKKQKRKWKEKYIFTETYCQNILLYKNNLLVRCEHLTHQEFLRVPAKDFAHATILKLVNTWCQWSNVFSVSVFCDKSNVQWALTSPGHDINNSDHQRSLISWLVGWTQERWGCRLSCDRLSISDHWPVLGHSGHAKIMLSLQLFSW